MELIETIESIVYIFIMGVLEMTPIALINGYLNQNKILSELEETNQELQNDDDNNKDKILRELEEIKQELQNDDSDKDKILSELEEIKQEL